MKIAVFIKQVPDTNDVKWTVNNNIDRSRMDSIINPVDKQAIEAGLYFKDNFGAYLTAITMGPDKSKEVLYEALAMGVDDAVLLSDPKFSGSDTCATSRVLAAFIEEKYKNPDIIIFGQSAIDGETSQTGPSTAARLNMPFITQVNSVLNVVQNTVEVSSDTDVKKVIYKVQLPCTLCINNFNQIPRLPEISGYIKAQTYEIKTYSHKDLNLNEEEIGIKGSPTWVKNVFKSPEGRICNYIEFDENNNCIKNIFDIIDEAAKS